MNTSPGSEEITTLNTLKEDAQLLGRDTVKMAHDHVVGPVVAIAHDAQLAVQQGAKRAQDVITDKIARTQKAVTDNVAQAQQGATRLRGRASACISNNPLASVAIAVLAGALLSSISRR